MEVKGESAGIGGKGALANNVVLRVRERIVLCKWLGRWK